ncbi:TerB family tellurite resistance protein [Campylobacter sp.]|uniref:TerB family tellurite resistance protein n=1 Tax=Campylobacter sp. TaxID=205 RepID=UPI0026FCC03F|nr:TerB family tellurite resistance protein [Campylobacter sp.]
MGNLLIIIAAILMIYYLSSGFRESPQILSGFKKQFVFEEAKYLVSLLAKVAKSDGRVNELEAQLVSEILDDITLKLGGDIRRREELKQIYNAEKENLNNTYRIAREYYLKFNLSSDAAIAKISFLLNLACIDGELSASEREIIEQIAIGLRVHRSVLDALFAKFDGFYSQRKSEQRSYSRDFKTTKQSPYATLNLSENAPFSEVKKRYRELVKKYHPDILMGRGESEEIIERSTRKLQEINEAYEEIKARNANN